MTQEELCTRLGELQASSKDASGDDDDDVANRASVRDMILRFERTAANRLSSSSESLERANKDSTLGSLTSVLHPTHLHFQHLNPVRRSQDRHSNVSVNSILSNVSENSYDSSSSGFVSDRKSENLIPHRPAPPPPAPFDDGSSTESKSPVPEESASRERTYSFTTTPNTSPVPLRRSRMPPVIRRKSSVSNVGHAGYTLWTYGVNQVTLEKLLRLRPSTDTEEPKYGGSSKTSEHETSSDESTDSENSNSEKGQCVSLNNGEGRTGTLSTDHSSDTLINEDDYEADNLSIASGAPSNYDNVSIKSISSFDMVPYQKYDSITVSSDEYGSEACHAQDVEFLAVSAVNEWCVSNLGIEPSSLPVSHVEKYPRKVVDPCSELLYSENVYVGRLKIVVEKYIPAMDREDLPPSLRGLKDFIFANIERIYKFHSEEFLPALCECEHDLRKIGQCFRKYEQKFHMYVMYARSNKRATSLIYEHKKFFQELQLDLTSEHQSRLDLGAYILEPVQRLPRYKMFLTSLIQECEKANRDEDSRMTSLSDDSNETGGSNGELTLTENEETPLESLRLAKNMIEGVLTAANGIMALENIRNLPQDINLLNQGQLLRQDEFSGTDDVRRSKQLMRVFLFDKMVLITTVYRKEQTVEFFVYKDHIPTNVLGTPKEDTRYKFTIWYKRRNTKCSYTLKNGDPAICNGWVEEINKLLWKQLLQEKALSMTQRKKRISMVSMNSQNSTDQEGNDDKYNSLRGVPGEVRRGSDKQVRRTTWYCE